MTSSHQRADEPTVSVVIPARNEALNLPGLIEEIDTALAGVPHETIVVDDGSTDDTAEVVRQMIDAGAAVRLIRHAGSFGQSAALRSGVRAADAAYVGTLDGDGQNDPKHFPDMLAMLAGNAALALVAGQRMERSDGRKKAFASRAANGIRARVLQDGTRDSACGLKLFRRDLFLMLPFFDGLHRYLPALVRREGYGVGYVDVVDRGRRHGTSNYGVLDRLLVGIPDILGVWWLTRRGRTVSFRTADFNEASET